MLLYKITFTNNTIAAMAPADSIFAFQGDRYVFKAGRYLIYALVKAETLDYIEKIAAEILQEHKIKV